jgi:hypothetical protein
VANAEKTRRVQMELSQSSFDRLNRIKDLVEAPSYTEVMKDALRLYEFIVQKDCEGSNFFFKSENGELAQIKIFA